jgi:ferredoxin
MAMKCWHCGKATEVVERVGFRDECAGCGRALHVCRNCKFYDPAYNNLCREPQAERVVDKERFNFCEYFAPGNGKGAGAGEPSKSAAQAKLEALFKKQ